MEQTCLFRMFQEFLIILKEPVPQPKKHESKEWYHSNISRTQAEDLLKKVPHEGAFLVRPSDKEQNTFVISFRFVTVLCLVNV